MLFAPGAFIRQNLREVLTTEDPNRIYIGLIFSVERRASLLSPRDALFSDLEYLIIVLLSFLLYDSYKNGTTVWLT